jgi:hypothetical protein
MYLENRSGDTLYAGEINQIVVVDSGNFSQDNLGAILAMSSGYDFPPCQQCFYDTLDATSVITDGFLTTITFDIPYGTYPNIYNIRVYDTLNHSICGERDWIWVLSKPYVFTPPEDQTVCVGEDVTLEVIAFEPGEILYQWYLDGQILSGATSSVLQIDNATQQDEGTYTCILSNDWGEASASATVNLFPYNDDVGIPTGPVLLCSGTIETSYALPEDPLIEGYYWVLIPEEAGSLNQNGPNVEVSWEPGFSGEAHLFAEIWSAGCPTPNSDTLIIRVLGQAPANEICIVGIDEHTGKYRLVWNKINDRKISAYHIFRESNQAGVFLRISTLPSEGFSVFVDSTSSPEALPHSYRMSYTDSCGNDSELSPVHTTIHLNANLGTGGENNLSWTHYQGFPFLTYMIYRGTHGDSLMAFQEVSSNVTSFTDLDPPAQRTYYQVVVSREGACQPSKKAGVDYSISKSNVVELSTVGIEDPTKDDGISVYPNPANEAISVKIPRTIAGQKAVISVYNITGTQVLFHQIADEITTLTTSHLIPGIYILQVALGQFSFYERIAIRR